MHGVCCDVSGKTFTWKADINYGWLLGLTAPVFLLHLFEKNQKINVEKLQVLRVKIFETNKRTTYKIELSGFGKVSASNWIESQTKNGTRLELNPKPHFLFATLSVDEQFIKDSHILSNYDHINTTSHTYIRDMIYYTYPGSPGIGKV